jgi:hypothetical protein
MSEPYTPTKEELMEAFYKTADALIGDYYDAWVAQGYEPSDFELPRESVVDYLSIYGGDNKDRIVEWIYANIHDWEKTANKYEVPISWVP